MPWVLKSQALLLVQCAHDDVDDDEGDGDQGERGSGGGYLDGNFSKAFGVAEAPRDEACHGVDSWVRGCGF